MGWVVRSWTAHALQGIVERGISLEAVEAALRSDQAEIIEDYADDARGPSFLVLGWVAGEPLHIVVAGLPAAGENVVVITTYRPADDRWEPDFRTRRARGDEP